jgi:succinate-semialdehyde dehydrogenase/glutarate-semialdehyde dehydrogenase
MLGQSKLSKSLTQSNMNLSRAATTSFIASSYIVRMISGLSTNIKLQDSTLLRVPEIESGRKTFEVCNPAASLNQVDDGTSAIALLDSKNRNDTRKAIEKSSIAFKKWSQKTTGMQRSKFLSRWSDLIKENEEDLAKLMTLESGKPLAESMGEIGYGASFLDYYAGEAIRPTNAGGGTIWPSPFSLADGSPKAQVMAIHEPIGVSLL